MGVLRDRIHSKLRRRSEKSTPSDEPRSSTPPSTPHPSAATPPSTSSFTQSSLRRFLPTSRSSTHSKSTRQTATTKIKRFLQQEPSSRVSNASVHMLDDVPDPEPRLIPLSDADPSSFEQASDTSITDGFVAFTVPPAWRAMRADDAVYLLSGRGVGFVKAVRAVDACEVLLEVGRLSVMSHVVVRSSPVWVGREATVEYSLDGGFGIGVARFQDGFDGGAVVFALCAPVENKQLVMDAVESIRRTAKLEKIPEAVEVQVENGENKKNAKGGMKDAGEEQTSESVCVIQ